MEKEFLEDTTGNDTFHQLADFLTIDHFLLVDINSNFIDVCHLCLAILWPAAASLFISRVPIVVICLDLFALR